MVVHGSGNEGIAMVKLDFGLDRRVCPSSFGIKEDNQLSVTCFNPYGESSSKLRVRTLRKNG